MAFLLWLTPALALAQGSFNLPATTTAYDAGDLMANSATGAAVAVPSFSLQSASGTEVIISRGRLYINDPTADSWNGQVITLSKVGAIAFTPDRGFTGNGVDAYLDTNWVPSTHGLHYTLNSASLWTWVISDILEPGLVIGTIGDYLSVVAPYSQMLGLGQIAINQATPQAFPSSTSLGFFGGQRRAIEDERAFINGIEAVAGTNPSLGLLVSPVTILALFPIGYSPAEVSVSAAGASIAGREMAFYTALSTYLNTVGALE